MNSSISLLALLSQVRFSTEYTQTEYKYFNCTGVAKRFDRDERTQRLLNHRPPLKRSKSMYRFCNLCIRSDFRAPNCQLTKCLTSHGAFDYQFAYCSCAHGYEGPRCEALVCAGHGSIIYDHYQGRRCRCQQYWHGANCTSMACLHGGRVHHDDDNAKICVCKHSFWGKHCERFPWEKYVTNFQMFLTSIVVPCSYFACVFACILLCCNKNKQKRRIDVNDDDQKNNNDQTFKTYLIAEPEPIPQIQRLAIRTTNL